MMTARRTSTALTAAVLALGAAGVTAGGPAAASPTPALTGCPTDGGFLLLSLAFLASQGPYQQPFALDAAGNNDGNVCGKPATQLVTDHVCGSPCVVPVLYNFIDNHLTPAF